MELKLEDGASHEESRREQAPRRHLPDLPRGRRAHFDMEEPPRLNLYEDSSIGGTYTHYQLRSLGQIAREKWEISK